MNLTSFTIHPSELLLEALKKIEQNRKGFLVVVSPDDLFLGTLTDGDVRRAFIKGVQVHDLVEKVYAKNAEKVCLEDGFHRIIELFKSPKIKFLPILDTNGRLLNIITKANMHVVLLGDIPFDIHFPFLELDDSTLEHELFPRPWGLYKTTFLNEYSQSKIIKVNPNGVLSLQEHKHREEYWIVISGTGEATVGESVKHIEAGSFVYIPKGCRHRLRNTSDRKALLIAEVQLGDYFGEDDILRYEDEYERV